MSRTPSRRCACSTLAETAQARARVEDEQGVVGARSEAGGLAVPARHPPRRAQKRHAHAGLDLSVSAVFDIVYRCRGPAHHLPLVRIRHHLKGVVQAHPAGLSDLVVVPGRVAADGLHQEVVHRLVDAAAALPGVEGVVDGTQLPADGGGDARLFRDFTDGGLALGSRPPRCPPWAAPTPCGRDRWA